MEKTIWDLEIHETLKVNNTLDVLRVPSGWIYHWYNKQVFVPYSVEGKML